MEFADFVPYIGLAVGVIGRVIIPWLVVKFEEDPPPEWEWRKASAQILTGFLAFLALVAANPQLPTLAWQQALAIGLGSAMAGWGVADMGRETRKATE